METKDDDLESSTITALLSNSQTALQSNIKEILPKFSSPLKTNFENRNLWLRFGLVLTLSRESPRSALQAFNECLRIDLKDPLPAMLAARLMLEDLDDPENGLTIAMEAIERCQRLYEPTKTTPASNETNETTDSQPLVENKSYYKNIAPLLSKCYLLASIMHAHIYEREPESIKHLKASNLQASLHNLDLATQIYSNDHLIYFHKALHEARQKSYSSAIDNIRQAIRLNPHHVPSMQLLILSLSALKLYDDALVLCESALHEFENNLLLLYIKCNLEQCLVETKGYKTALSTAQHMLKCIKEATTDSKTSTNTDKSTSESKQTTILFAEDTFTRKGQEDLFSGESSIWLLVAEIFIKIGSISDAEHCVDEGSSHINVALSHQILFTRGLIAKAKNNLLEAKSFFQSCLALCPRHAKALQQVAHVHYLLGNHSTAEKFLKDSLDIDSDCHKTWHYLSLVFIETNQHDKASEYVKRATTLEETSPVISISAIPRLTLDGYFRARISSLSDFDKIIGAIAWALQFFSYDLNINIFYTDTLDLGQKIALTERLVMVLIAMGCPHPIEPHQIVGLDYQNLLPVLDWLIKRSAEARELAAFNRLLALRHFHRVTNTLPDRSHWCHDFSPPHHEPPEADTDVAHLAQDNDAKLDDDKNDNIPPMPSKLLVSSEPGSHISFVHSSSLLNSTGYGSNTTDVSIDDDREDTEEISTTFNESGVADLKIAGDDNDVDERNEQLHNELNTEIIVTNQKILNLVKELDSIPSSMEIAQYQKRYIELHQQLISKNKDLKKIYAISNSLESTKHYLVKEINLLDSIMSNLPVANSSAKNRESFQRQFQEIVQQIGTVRDGVTSRLDMMREKRNLLQEEYQRLLE